MYMHIQREREREREKVLAPAHVKCTRTHSYGESVYKTHSDTECM
jgi:hypothetical protein